MENEITDIGKVAITPRKDYKNEQTYEWLDVVTYTGASYMCIAEDGCTGIVPTNTDYWQLLAKCGDPGEKGDTGDIGPMGPKPVNGVDYNTEAEQKEFKDKVVADSKADLEKYIAEKETQLDNYTKDKETKLDDYVTDTVKPAIDTYVTDTTKKDIDKYEKEKEKVLDTYADTKKTEIDNYVTNTSKPAIDQYEKEKEAELETAKNTAISEYDAHAENVLTETEDLFNALDTEKSSGTELYIEDAKPCRVINTGISGMYKQENTTGKQIATAYESTNTTTNYANIIFRGKSIVLKPATTYTLSFKGKAGDKFKTSSGEYGCCSNSTNVTVDTNGIGIVTFTTVEDFTDKQTGIIANISANNTLPLTNICIAEGEYEELPFEPYTGGNPSPSPNYPKTIEQVESVILKSVNKNWYPFNGIKITSEKTTSEWVFVDGTAGAYGTTIGNKTSYKFKLLKGVYTIKCSKTNSNVLTFQIVDEREEMYINLSTTNFTRTITLDEDKILIVRMRLTNPSLGADISDLQIEKGTTATTYEPYKNQTINMNLKGNKLCAISDTIKDKLLIDRNGNVALQKNVGNITLSKDNIFSRIVLSNGDILYRTVTNIVKSSSLFVLCNYYRGIKSFSSRADGTIYLNTSSSNAIDIIDNNASITTVDQYKTFVENNQIEVYYSLATPELIDLGQLPELPKTFNGVNNIWAETNLGNTEIEIEYVQDVKKLLEKQTEQQNARLDNIEALLSTTQTSALLLDNMQDDLEKEVK